MNLDTTNKYITLQLIGAVTTNQLDVVVTYSDYGTSFPIISTTYKTN